MAIHKLSFAVLILLSIAGVTLGCATAATRDTKADLKLSQRKVSPDAAKTTEILKEPQPGFAQEPKENF